MATESNRFSVKDYLIDIFTTYRFISKATFDSKNLEDSRKAKELLTDSLKCIAISHFVVYGYLFGKGRQHYSKYIKGSFYAVLLGLTYAPYYTYPKLLNYQAENLAKKELNL